MVHPKIVSCDSNVVVLMDNELRATMSLWHFNKLSTTNLRAPMMSFNCFKACSIMQTMLCFLKQRFLSNLKELEAQIWRASRWSDTPCSQQSTSTLFHAFHYDFSQELIALSHPLNFNLVRLRLMLTSIVVTRLGHSLNVSRERLRKAKHSWNQHQN